MVFEVFEERLDREPSRAEINRYIELIIEENLSYRELKREIRSEYRSNRGSSHRNYRERDQYQPRRWVESIFEERIGRLPNQSEMEDYCELCLDEKYDRRALEREIRRDYEGVYEPYANDRNYHYDYDRYSSKEEIEIIIEEAYQDILGRKVDTDGMRNYRTLMIDKRWSEKRVRAHLANSPELLWEKYSKIVNRAYEDLLDRKPSIREQDGYVDDMIKHHWDERKMRGIIRRSQEYQYTRPRQLIDKAYNEVLLRDPDAGSVESLRKEMVRKDWSLTQVKDHLRKSPEYKNVTIPKMITIAYRDLLDREPDEYGKNFYATRARKGWSFEEIKNHIRKSDEYRNKH